MGNGIGIPNDKGTINAVPDRLDVYHAKELAGSRWDSELFECLAEPQTGTISREQFLLAPLLDRRMLLEAVRITREDVGEGENPHWYPLRSTLSVEDHHDPQHFPASDTEASTNPADNFDVEFFRSLEAGRPAPTFRDPLRLGISLAGLRHHRKTLVINELPNRPLSWKQNKVGCAWEGSCYQHQVALLHAAHEHPHLTVCEKIEEEEGKKAVEEKIENRSSRNIGIANVFVSFWLGNNFDELIDTLERYLLTNNLGFEDTYFWIFDYCIRHHGANLPEKLVEEISTMVQRIGHTVLVVPDTYSRSNIHIGDEPLSPRTLQATPSNFVRTLHLPAVHRIWCSWEVYCTARAVKLTKGIFRIAGTEAWDAAFLDAILEKRELNFADLENRFQESDIKSAHASNREDKRVILHKISEQISHHGHRIVDNAVNSLLLRELSRRAHIILKSLPRLQLRQATNNGSTAVGNEGQVREFSPLIVHVARLLEVQGRFSEAAALYRESLEAARSRFGDESEIVFEICQALGNIMYFVDRSNRDGESLLREAFEGRRKMFGITNALTLQAQFCLAECFARNGTLDESEKMHRVVWKALRDQNRNSGASVTSAEALARVLKALGRFTEAIGVLDDYPKAKAHSNLTTEVGMVLYEQGQVKEALAIFQHEYDDRKKYLGARDERTLQSLNNLAFLLQRGANQPEAAEPLFRSALDARREILGNHHSSTLNSIFSLADCLMKIGRIDEALPLYREEMILSQKILGDHHPDTEISIKTMEKALSLCIRRAQRAANGHDHLDEAERLFSAIVSCQRPALGDMHPDTIKSVGALSHVLKKQHKLAEALPLYRQVAAFHRATYGDTDVETLHHIFELAELLKHQHHITHHQHGDEFDLEAEALYREVIKGRHTTLGYTHADTMNAIKHLAILLRHMPGRHAEAEHLMREIEGV